MTALRIRHLCCASAGSAFVQLHKLNEKMAAWIHARTMSEETAHNTNFRLVMHPQNQGGRRRTACTSVVRARKRGQNTELRILKKHAFLQSLLAVFGRRTSARSAPSPPPCAWRMAIRRAVFALSRASLSATTWWRGAQQQQASCCIESYG